jgi:hypothetical protein
MNSKACSILADKNTTDLSVKVALGWCFFDFHCVDMYINMNFVSVNY